MYCSTLTTREVSEEYSAQILIPSTAFSKILVSKNENLIAVDNLNFLV